jgi:AcrR family transcriptional regulator
MAEPKQSKTKREKIGNKKPKAKGLKKETKEKILAAARHVFSNYPYHAASIRTIGKLAGIEHPLISYYFPNKADLFRAVMEEVAAAYIAEEKKMFERIKTMSPERGFALFLDLKLDFFRQRPEIYRLMALNLIQSVDDDPIPGYDLIQKSINTSIKNFTEIVQLRVSEYEVDMLARSMFSYMVDFPGAASIHASLLNMDPESFLYLNWVKETILYTTLPRLKLMVQPS